MVDVVVFALPSMLFHQRVTLLDSPADAHERTSGILSLLAACRDSRPEDVYTEFDPVLSGELAAAFRLTRTHMHDPFGEPSETPMKRTTNFIVVSIGRAVVVLTGMQAGDGPVDPVFLEFAELAIARVDEVVSHQDELTAGP